VMSSGFGGGDGGPAGPDGKEGTCKGQWPWWYRCREGGGEFSQVRWLGQGGGSGFGLGECGYMPDVVRGPPAG